MNQIFTKWLKKEIFIWADIWMTTALLAFH